MQFRRSLLGCLTALACAGPALAQTSATLPVKNGTGATVNVAGQQDASGGFHYRDVLEGLQVDGVSPKALYVDGNGFAHIVVESGSLPSGAATSANQTSANTKLDTVHADLGTLNGQVATAAKQPALGTAGNPSSDVITVQGATSMIPLQVSPTPSTLTGTTAPATITNASTQLLAAGSRRLLAIKNESTTASIACNFGGTAALNTAGSYTIPPGLVASWVNYPVPADAVNCISSAATSPATIEAN